MMEKYTEIKKRFQNTLKAILPSFYDRLMLKVSYVVKNQDKIVLERDIYTCSTENCLCAEYMAQVSHPWYDMDVRGDRCDDGEDQYYLHWMVYCSDSLPEQSELVVGKFLTIFLENLVKGFVDYEMFETLDHGIVIDHLFSFVEDQEHLLNMFVEDVLEKYELPGKNILTQLSAQMYEKRPMHGQICFIEEDVWKEWTEGSLDGVWLDFRYLSRENRSFCVENLKQLRKLLEINTKETVAISVNKSYRGNKGKTDNCIEGIIFCGNEREQGAVKDLEQFPRVEFYGYLKWRLYIHGVEWFSYDNGLYKICSERREKQWKQELGRVNLKEDEAEVMMEVISLLSNESHGTSVVFMEECILADTGGKMGEVNRLSEKNRCIKVCEAGDGEHRAINIGMYLKYIKGITSIDGAIMADMEGNIYAIGTILDGEAQVPGDMSRGARHNSVENYLSVVKKKNKEINMFGVIVSEDRDVSLVIPN